MAQRTLTAKQDTARAGATPKFRGQGLYWLVEVQWSDPLDTEYYTARSFAPDPAVTPIPILIEVPGCPAALDIGVSATPISGNTTLTLRNDPLSASSIEAVLQDAVSPEGTVVKVYLVFDPRDGSALAEADWILINTYTIDSPPKYTYGIQPKVSFSLIDNIEGSGAKEIGRKISRDLFPDANLPPSSLGRMITKVYGEVLGVEAIATVQGHVTELDGSIEDDNATIFVKTVEGFPAGGGTILVDAEPMTYTDVTAGINASFNGVTRDPDLAVEHSDGASVVEVLDLYEYALTDHVNDNTENTRVNGKAVAASIVETAVDGQTVTFLTLTELPTISEFATSSQRTRFFGPTDWAANSSTVASYIRSGGEFQLIENDATGAIDEEPDGVTFALFDPKAATPQTALSVTFSEDLSERDSRFVALDLVVTYQIVPGENLPATVEEFPWNAFRTRITRNGVVAAEEDIPRPSPIVYRGFFDRTDFVPEIFDTTQKFDDLSGAMERRQEISFRGNNFVVRPLGGLGANNVGYWKGTFSGQQFNGINSVAFIEVEDATLVLTNFRSTSLWVGVDIPAGIEILGFDLTVSARAPTQSLVRHSRFDPFVSEANSQGGDVEVRFISSSGATLASSREQMDNGDVVDLLLSWTAPGSVDSSLIAGGRIEIQTFAPASGQATPAMMFLDVNIDSVTFRSWEPADLPGSSDPITGDTTTIANALLSSASGQLKQRVRMTAFARTQFDNPFDFFAEPQTIEIDAENPVAATRLIVSSIEWELDERPIVTRQLTEREIVLTADVRGITDGGLLEDPESVITHLLEDADDGWGLPSADIDATGLTAALVGRENWKFARAITETTTGKALLSEACRDANIRYVQDGGEIRFAGNLFPIIDDVPANAAITRDQIMPDLTKTALHRELTINDLRLNFKRDPAGFEFLEFHEEARAQAAFGNSGVQQTTLDLLWVRDRGTAEALSRRILNESATPPQVIQLMTVAMWGAHILATDIVSVEDDGANLDLMPGLVIGRNNPRGENCTFSILTRQVQIRVWTAAADDTTYIDAYQGSRLVFVINGVKVAVLDADAIFTLKGGIASAIVTGTQTEIIEKLAGPDRISFAADKGNLPPDRNQVGQLTASGVLQVQFFKTSQTIPSTPGGSPFTDYIVERNTGSFLGAVIFSADKERLICNMALAAIEARQFVYDPNL